MIHTLIRYFFIALWSKYLFQKFRNAEFANKYILIQVISSMIASIATYAIAELTPGLNILTLLVILFFSNNLISKRTISFNLISTIVTLAVSYMFFLLSAILVGPISYIFHSLLSKDAFQILSILFTSTMQFFLIFLFFKIKRFSKGFPDFEDNIFLNIATFISVTALLLISLLNSDSETGIDLGAALISIIICVLGSVIIFFEIRKHITETYKNKLQQKNVEMLENTIRAQESEISVLKADLLNLSKIIHRDNKIIPAMLLTVESMYLQSDESEINSFLLNLQNLVNERKGVLTDYEQTNKVLPKSGFATIDALFHFFLARANTKQLSFDLSISGELHSKVSSSSDESDLRTLIADLTENALIAISPIKDGKIFIHIDAKSQNLALHFFDNGPNFSSDVIEKMGYKQFTTHASQGGSGIGLMQTFEFLHKYRASFELEEYQTDSMYKKRVSIIFDENSEIRILSNRPEIKKAGRKRDDLIFLESFEKSQIKSQVK